MGFGKKFKKKFLGPKITQSPKFLTWVDSYTVKNSIDEPEIFFLIEKCPLFQNMLYISLFFTEVCYIYLCMILCRKKVDILLVYLNSKKPSKFCWAHDPYPIGNLKFVSIFSIYLSGQFIMSQQVKNYFEKVINLSHFLTKKYLNKLKFFK